eukprot:4400007-Prymnesium_polylepis.1
MNDKKRAAKWDSTGLWRLCVLSSLTCEQGSARRTVVGAVRGTAGPVRRGVKGCGLYGVQVVLETSSHPSPL